MKRLTFLLLSLLPLSLYGQEASIPLSLSLFNNGTSLPGGGYLGVFSKNLHPGITLGTGLTYRQRPRTALFQTLKLGYFYHRHAQHAVQLYSEFGYRYYITRKWYAEGLPGLGYLHSFADMQQFRWEQGRYVPKKNYGRPQFMLTASLSAGYDLTSLHVPLRLFLQYQFWLQAPFVNKYVPLLPNTALHIGAVYQLPRSRKQPSVPQL